MVRQLVPADRRDEDDDGTRAVGAKEAAGLEAVQPGHSEVEQDQLRVNSGHDRKRFLALLGQLVDINNQHSRAPRRIENRRPGRRAAGRACRDR